MICNQCKKGIPEESVFCPFCGKNQTQAIVTLDQIHESWRKIHYRKISITGREGYGYAWRRLEPLSQKPVEQLTLEDFQTVLDCMLPTSRSNQQKVQQLIGQLCKHSFLFGNGLRYNYAAYLDLGGYRSKETLIYSDAQIFKLWEYACDRRKQYNQAARITMCLIFTGLRPNEFFDLKKEDFNMRYRFLIAAGSKTAAGKNRMIPIITAIWPFIAEWYLAANKSEQGKPSYLLVRAKGERYNLHNWRQREFYPLMQELEMNQPKFYGEQKITPYSCRHTYASLAFRADVDRDILKKMIGHTNWNFTAKTYVHAQIEQFVKEASKIQMMIDQIAKSTKEEKIWF